MTRRALAVGARLVGLVAAIVLHGAVVCSAGLPPARFVPNELLIGLSPEAAAGASATSFAQGRLGLAPLDELASRFGVREVTPVFSQLPYGGLTSAGAKLERIFKLELGPGADIFEALTHFSRQAEIEFVELNTIYEATLLPSDPEFEEQWALSNDGSRGARRDADIDAPEAWDIHQGRAQTLIAIVDTGVSGHPDLRRQRVRRDLGWDFVNDRRKATDDHGHGTYVAGIAAADTNNRRGVAGVCWRCGIVPVKVLDEDGRGTAEWVASGIQHAAEVGAQIISMSLGASSDCGCSETIAAAINYAWEEGALLIAASGNDSDKEKLSYPAASSRVMAIGASDDRDEEARFSNRDQTVVLLAPGVDVLGLDARKGEKTYREASGTSAAAPHVSGVAGLLMSLDPLLENAQVWRTLKNRSDRLGRGLPRRLNAFKSLRRPVLRRVGAPEDRCAMELECPPGCPSEVALSPQLNFGEWVQGLRRLRDDVLRDSVVGSRLAAIYERHAFEIGTMLLLDGQFRKDVRRGLAEWSSLLLGASLDDWSLATTTEQVASARWVLEGLKARASEGLRRDLQKAESALEDLGLLSVGVSRAEALWRLRGSQSSPEEVTLQP